MEFDTPLGIDAGQEWPLGAVSSDCCVQTKALGRSDTQPKLLQPGPNTQIMRGPGGQSLNLMSAACHFKPLNAELNPICHLLALLGAHHILHISGLRVKQRRGEAYFLQQTHH